jgi:CHAT domain-containing protein/tetratricopeptide (TPR) repeat protein
MQESTPDETESERLSLLQELARPEAREPRKRAEICRRALAILSPEQRAQRSSIWRELGDALLLDVSGSRAESLEEAVHSFEAALAEAPSDLAVGKRAELLSRLGNSYRNRFQGNRATNVEKALDCYQSALDLMGQERFSETWAILQGSLGMGYSERLLGDRAENLELARVAYEEAIQVFTRERFPVEWSVTANNLANVYRDRLRGDPAENLERAIHLFEECLEVRRRDVDPVQWGVTVHNLAIAYRRRILGNPKENIDRAIDLARQALEVRTRERSPRRWASTLCTLGNAWSKRQDETSESLHRALDAYESALEVATPASDPQTAATILRNLAKIRGVLYLRHGEGDAESALAAGQAALEIHQLDTAPNDHRHVADILGTILFGLERWGEAAQAFQFALAATQRLYQAGATPESRSYELREGRDLGARAAYCFAQVGRLVEAVETLEGTRTRALSEAFALDAALLDRVQVGHREALERIRQRIRLLEAEARAVGPGEGRSFLEISADLGSTRRELHGLLEAIQVYIPEFYQADLPFSEIRRLALDMGQPLIQLLTVTWGTLALIILPAEQDEGSVRAVWFPGFTDSLLASLLFRGDPPLLSKEEPDPGVMRSALDAAWPLLEAQLANPLVRSLQASGVTRGVLLPTGWLSLLPLQALVGDRLLLTSAPSVRLLRAAFDRAARCREHPPVFLGVGTSPLWRPLPLARHEVETAATVFHPNRRRLFLDTGARRADVVAGLSGVTHLHFACHGKFALDQPLDSALQLSDGEQITVRDLLDGNLDLSAARLTVLSACRSGLAEYELTPDEAIGFPAVLLQAGVPTVLGTLWPVADLSSTFLMGRFYQMHFEEGLPAGEALWAAQAWLREATAGELELVERAEQLYAQAFGSTERALAYQMLRRFRARPDLCPYAHPYYWAGFFVMGDPGRAFRD